MHIIKKSVRLSMNHTKENVLFFAQKSKNSNKFISVLNKNVGENLLHAIWYMNVFVKLSFPFDDVVTN